TKKRTPARYLTMSILFAFGLMSKPMLVTLPIVLLLLDYWPLNRAHKSDVRIQKKESIWSLIVEKLPLFTLSIGSCVATLWAQNLALGSATLLPFKWRIVNAILSYFDYLRLMF